MPYTDVYLGALSDGADPLDWGDENKPPAFRPYKDSNYVFFPPASPPAFFNIFGKIKRGEVCSRQIDWGCWAAKMSKKEIIDFIGEVYLGSPYGDGGRNSDDEWGTDCGS